MRLSTLIRTAAAVLVLSPAAMAQSAKPSYNFPVGYDRASGMQPSGTAFDARVDAEPQPVLFRALSEGFDTITTLPAAGWSLQNLSSPLGATGWFQGTSPNPFPSQSGPPTSYIGANFNNTGTVGTISNWLITPEQPLSNGTVLRFFTRTVTGAPFPDRLQVRLSTAGASTNVGATATSEGDFTTVLLDINSGLITGPTGYPDVYTEYTITVTGLVAATTGRFAFRYFVTDGGANGANSNFIGIDNVTIAAPAAGTTLSVTPATVPFGSVPIGQTVTRPVTITNTGATPVVISSIALTGSSQFTAAGNTPGTLAVGASQTVTLSYTATTATAQTGTLTVTSNATGSPATIAITGTGVNQSTVAFCSGTALTIPDVGIFAPYPGVVTVSGITASQVVTDVNIRFVGLSHEFPGDLDVFVEHPLGPTAVLMSDVGGGTDVVGVNLTIDDEATAPFTAAAITAGSYRPTNTGAVDPYPAPAPVPSGTSLAAFDNANPNGTWKLYGVDDASGDLGALTDFCVDLTVSGAIAGEGTATAGQSFLTAAPNPVRGEASVRFGAATAQDVTVAVYDVTGRQVATLFSGAVAAGQTTSVRFDGAALPSGVYVVRAIGTDVNLAQRVTVVR